MYDLLYCGEHEQRVREMVVNDFPDFKIEDASDYIHIGRFSVEGECKDDDWFLWLLRQGVFEMSFHWEMTAMFSPKSVKPLIKQIVEERKTNTAPTDDKEIE